MKIKIKHLGTIVEIDEQTTGKTSIHYEHDTINGMVSSTIESITKNQQTPPEDPNKEFRDVVTDVCERLLADNEIKVNKKQVTKIHRDASECLKMLDYWDEFTIIDTGANRVVQKRLEESNTMKVVKSFLNELITKFPDNENH